MARGSREPRPAHNNPVLKQEKHTTHSSPSLPNSTALQAETAQQLKPLPSANIPPRDHRSAAPSVSDTFHQTQYDEPLFMERRCREAVVEAASMQNQGDSFFSLSFQDIGQKLKACNDTLAELQQIGVSHDVSLPELVLVGDQSAGKSSLMSGLADLDLPRNDGVCTRCPMHIRLSRSRDNALWSCRISLQLDYSYQPPQGRPITVRDVTKANPFPPWVKQNRVIKEFVTITDRRELEKALRWAQVAILNPSLNHEFFLPDNSHQSIQIASENTQASFSPNVVALEIKGPDLPDLSFYDLPGIIKLRDREDEAFLVGVVENLSREYISHPSAMIIWACPMTVDPEVSSTFTIIRRERAVNRTIGVLTKADLLQKDANHRKWLDMLAGTSFKTGLGYFMTTRQPDSGLEEQKRWEEGFFDHIIQNNWPEYSTEYQSYAEQLGVERLKAFLTKKLGEVFSKSLPSIKAKVSTRLREIRSQLDALPELPDNVELEVSNALRDFYGHVRDELRSQEFSARYARLAQCFRECLLRIKPKINMRDNMDKKKTIDLTIDDDSDHGVNTPTGRRNRPAGGAPTPSAKRARTVNGTPLPDRSLKNEESDHAGGGNSASPQGSVYGGGLRLPGPRQPPMPEPFHGLEGLGSGFRTLREIRRDIAAKQRAGIPCHVPVEVQEELCKEAITIWREPLSRFLAAAMDLVAGVVKQALQTSLASLQKRLVYRDSEGLIRAFLDRHFQGGNALLQALFETEKYQVFTMNEELFKLYLEQEHTTLVRYRHYQRWWTYVGPGGVAASGAPPFVEDVRQLTDEQRVKEEKARAVELAKIGPDPFGEEVDVASYVRAYYRLASLRFCDAVSMAVASRMFPQITRDLRCHLEKELGLEGAMGRTHQQREAVYARLMEEDEHTARRREMLKREKERFEKAMDSIEELERQSGPGEVDGLGHLGSGSGSGTMATPVADGLETAETMDLDHGSI